MAAPAHLRHRTETEENVVSTELSGCIILANQKDLRRLEMRAKMNFGVVTIPAGRSLDVADV